MKKKPLRDQVVVVTGASSGLGRAIAAGAGARGARVVVAARNEDGLAGAVRDVERAGSEALAVRTEVADLEGNRRRPGRARSLRRPGEELYDLDGAAAAARAGPGRRGPRARRAPGRRG